LTSYCFKVNQTHENRNNRLDELSNKIISSEKEAAEERGDGEEKGREVHH
jgi:hypothetical protein